MSTKRRMPASSGYIGSGNKTSVFNRKPRIPFTKLRVHIDQELLNLEPSKSNRKRLTNKERIEMKEKIRLKLVSKRRLDLVFALVAVLITSAIVFLISVIFLN